MSCYVDIGRDLYRVTKITGRWKANNSRIKVIEKKYSKFTEVILHLQRIKPYLPTYPFSAIRILVKFKLSNHRINILNFIDELFWWQKKRKLPRIIRHRVSV